MPLNRDIFVQNVKYFCKEKGLAPTVACKEAGVSSSFLTNITRKGQTPSVEKVELLAHYLGVTVSDLLGEQAVAAQLSQEAVAVARAYDNADPALQEAARRVLGVE